MSNTAIMYVVAGCAAVMGLSAFVVYILVPAWTTYQRTWERVMASVLAVYVLAACVAVGTGLGLGVIWFWDRVFGEAA